jgi:MGT family glycosyltransferase
MLADGHVRRLLPLIAGVVARGWTAHVFTDRRFESEVRAAGGQLVDLFGKYPQDDADAESFPIALRSVAYAGHYAAAVQRDLAALNPALVIYDTFAMLGRVVAIRMGLPYVNVCAGHNVEPERFQKILAADPRVFVSGRCLEAVETLRTRLGVADASPFSYVSGLSPHLNVYGEPPEFLTASERHIFEPVGFFGSLPAAEEIASRAGLPRPPVFKGGRSVFRLYVSFGTVVWRSYAAEALAALEAIAVAVSRRPDFEVIMSLGGATVPAASMRRLRTGNVTVTEFVPQWAVLAEADAFITHHGLNSTHEAIFNRVPMLSYPFFWDQPALAAKCQAFGVALPLAGVAREAITADTVDRALDRLVGGMDVLRTELEVVRSHELRVMAGREAVLDRMLALA